MKASRVGSKHNVSTFWVPYFFFKQIDLLMCCWLLCYSRAIEKKTKRFVAKKKGEERSLLFEKEMNFHRVRFVSASIRKQNTLLIEIKSVDKNLITSACIRNDNSDDDERRGNRQFRHKVFVPFYAPLIFIGKKAKAFREESEEG